MQLCDGGTVLEMMNSRLERGFSEQEVLRIFTDVLLAVRGRGGAEEGEGEGVGGGMKMYDIWVRGGGCRGVV